MCLASADPERGVSTLKEIKSVKRNQLGHDTLQQLMMIVLNGPKPGTPEHLKLLNLAVDIWFLRGPGRKVKRPAGIDTPENRAILAEHEDLFPLFGSAASSLDRHSEVHRHDENDTSVRDRIATGRPAEVTAAERPTRPLYMKTRQEVEAAVLETGPAAGFAVPTAPPSRSRNPRIIADLGFPGVTGMGQQR